MHNYSRGGTYQQFNILQYPWSPVTLKHVNYLNPEEGANMQYTSVQLHRYFKLVHDVSTHIVSWDMRFIECTPSPGKRGEAKNKNDFGV